MLNLSITPMDSEHIEETCEDLRMQQEKGITDCAMLMMFFAPEGTPPLPKAEIQCKLYDQYAERLNKMGVRHGVLVQSTLGHIVPPSIKHPFQNVVGLVTDTEYDTVPCYDKYQMVDGVFTPQCCPYDRNFQAYLREQMRVLATRHPSVIMIDDDMGILYRIGIKGCACPLHMAEFNRRAGKNLTREQLLKHVYGDSEEDKRLTQIFIDVQGDSLVQAARAMREGIDSVDPTVQGAISTAGNYCEFTDEIASAFAGKGNPTIARFNNGNFGAPGPRGFSKHMLRAATQKNFMKGKIDLFLAETDTCPHTRYSTSASFLHAHYAATILEGAKGAKHWITTSSAGFDLETGRAYREILSKYSGFYQNLADLSDELKPVGCRIPLSTVRDFCLRVPNIFSSRFNLSSWESNVLERLGLPLYFSAEEGGGVFLDDNAFDHFTHEDFLSFFRGAVFLSGRMARILQEAGYGKYLGVESREWTGPIISRERVRETNAVLHRQEDIHELIPLSETVKVLSDSLFDPGDGNYQALFPAVTSYRNELGGTAVVFSGTCDTTFHYAKIVGYLNSSRKKQLISVLRETGNLPIYYPGDIEVYLRAGYLSDGTLMCAVFNLGLDQMEEIPLVAEKPVEGVEMLSPDGKRVPVDFEMRDGVLYVKTPAYTLMPAVLFLS